MSENSGEQFGSRVVEKFKPVVKTGARAVAAIGLAASLLPFLEPGSVNADTPIPAASAAKSPTPLPVATGTLTPGSSAEIAAEQKKLDDAAEKLKNQKALNNIRATQTVVAQEMNAALGTPTATATPPPSTPTLTPDRIRVKQEAGILPKDPTPVNTVIVKLPEGTSGTGADKPGGTGITSGNSNDDKKEGFPWGKTAGAFALTAGVAAVLMKGQSIMSRLAKIVGTNTDAQKSEAGEDRIGEDHYPTSSINDFLDFARTQPELFERIFGFNPTDIDNLPGDLKPGSVAYTQFINKLINTMAGIVEGESAESQADKRADLFIRLVGEKGLEIVGFDAKGQVILQEEDSGN